MDRNSENYCASNDYEKDKLILELKEIIQEYEIRLNSKDKNFQLQFSELQNELLEKDVEFSRVNNDKTKLECQLLELQDLVDENHLVIKSKDTAIQIIQDDLKTQLENLKSHHSETLLIRQEEIESLRATGKQLRDQLAIRENDMIQLMQRHENQIVNLFQEIKTKDEESDVDQMASALKTQITSLREILMEKQESLKINNQKLEQQDQLIRQLQEQNFNLIEETKKYTQMKFTDETYQNHVDQLNESIKDSKKKQLTFKAKSKSFEKQLTTLKANITKEEDKVKELRNDLDIREKIIEKQNILIDELRQTERGLRDNLNHSFATQEEQLLDLKYWERFKYLIPDCKDDNSDQPFSTEPLVLAIENLESLHVEEAGKQNLITDVIKKLYSYQERIERKCLHSTLHENIVNSLRKSITNINQLNLNLNKHLGILVKDYETFMATDVEHDTTRVELENLKQYSQEELITKLLIFANQTYSYNEKFSNLEKENFQLTSELNKITEMCCNMCYNVEKAFQDIDFQFISTGNEIKLLDKSQSFDFEVLSTKICEKLNSIRHDIENNISSLHEENETINEILVYQIKNIENQTENLRNLVNMEKIIPISKNIDTKPIDNIQENIEITTRENILTMSLIKEEKDTKTLLNQFIVQISHLEEKINEINIQNENSKGELFEVISEKKNILNELDDVKQKLIISEKENEENSFLLKDMSNQILNLKQILEDESSLENIQRYELTILKEEKDNLTKELRILNEKISVFEDEKEKNQKLTEDLKDQLLKIAEDLSSNENNLKLDLNNMEDEKKLLIDELKDLKENLTIFEKKKDQNDSVTNELNMQITILKQVLEEKNDNESKLKDKLVISCLEKDNLTKELNIINEKIMIFNKEKDESKVCITDLKDQLLIVKETVGNMCANENILKANLTNSVEEKRSVISQSESLNEKILVVENEILEKDSLLNEMNSQISNLKHVIEERSGNELKLQDELNIKSGENESLKKELEILNQKILFLNEEKENNIILVNQLNDQILTVKKLVDDIGVNENNLKEDLKNIKEEKQNLMKELKDLKENMMITESETKDKDGLINELNYHILLLKQMLEEKIDIENKLKEELKVLFDEKEHLFNEVQILNDQMSMLNKQDQENNIVIRNLNDQSLDVKKVTENMASNENKLKENLKNIEDEKEIVMQELVLLKENIIAFEKEKDSFTNEFNNQIAILTKDLVERIDNESKLKDELFISGFEKGNLTKELNILNDKITIFNKEKEESDMHVTDLNDQLDQVKSIVKNIGANENILKTDLNNSEEEKRSVMLQLKELKEKILIIENEMGDKDCLLNELNNEISKLEDIIETAKDNELKLKEELNITVMERKSLTKEMQILNDKLTIFHQEKEENQIYINDLNDQLSMVKNIIGDMNVDENSLKENLKNTEEEKQNVMKELTDLKENIMIFKNEKEETAFTLNALKNQMKLLQQTLEQRQDEESKLKDELQITAVEKEKLVKELQFINEQILKCDREKEENNIYIRDLNNEKLNLERLVVEKCALATKFEEELKIAINKIIHLNENMVKLENEKKESHIFNNVCNNQMVKISFLLEKMFTKDENFNYEFDLVDEENEKSSDELNIKSQEEINSSINDINNKIMKLAKILKNTKADVMNSTDSLKHIGDDKENLIKELNNLKIVMSMLEKEKADNICLINGLNEQIVMFNEDVKELRFSDMNTKQELEVAINDKNNIMMEMEKYKSDICCLTKEITGMMEVLGEKNATEQKLKDELQRSIEEFEIINNKMNLLEKEKMDNESMLLDLNVQIVSLKEMVKELSTASDKDKIELKSVIDDKNELHLEMEELNSKLRDIDMKYKESNLENHAINEERLKLKMTLGEMIYNEEKLKNELNDAMQCKNNNSFELEEKQSSMEILQITLENKCKELDEAINRLSLLAKENSDNLLLIEEIKEQNNKLSLELNEKKVNFEQLDKNYLILKARLIKFKKQSEEKIVTLTTERDELLQNAKNNLLVLEKEALLKSSHQSISIDNLNQSSINNTKKSVDLITIHASCQCDLLEYSEECNLANFGLLKDQYLLSGYNFENNDEKSLFNQIENLSDEVDAKIKKVNLELEEFLERNERMTSSLVPRSSPSRHNSCTETQCQNLLVKHRELSITTKKLQEQNQLLKNKIIDLYKYIEKEQEIYKHIHQEELQIKEKLSQKVNVATSENVQLHLQITHFKEETKTLKRENKKLDETVARLQIDLSNLSVRYTDLSEHNSRILEENLSLRENESRDDIIARHTQLISQLKADKNKLQAKSNILLKENNEVHQSLKLLQVDIEELTKEYNIYKITNDMLNDKIGELISVNEDNKSHIRLLSNRIEYLENQDRIESTSESNANHYVLESTMLLINDINELTSKFTDEKKKYLDLLKVNKNMKQQMQICWVQSKYISDSIDELITERDCLREKINNLETEKYSFIKRIKEHEIKQTELASSLQYLENECLPINPKNEENLWNQDEILDVTCNELEKADYSTRFMETTPPQLLTVRLENRPCSEITEQYVLDRLKYHFFIDSEIRIDNFGNNFEDIFEELIEIIKTNINNPASIDRMIDAEIQTNVDNVYLNKLESWIANSTSAWTDENIEFGNDNDKPEIELLKNIEPCINSVKLLKDQVDNLRKDLHFEEYKKDEMGDKFESIIIELESACDSEVEKWKLSNELIKQEVIFLKTVREEQDNHLNSLKNQIFELQLELTKSKTEVVNEELVGSVDKSNDNSLLWMSNFNDALKDTISEKEDQITELMKQSNELSNKIKEAQLKEESHKMIYDEIKNRCTILETELLKKGNIIQLNLSSINELEVACVEKDNIINSLEKKLTDTNYHLEVELQNKEKLNQDNVKLAEKLEVDCLQKDNRINALEKELTVMNSRIERYNSLEIEIQNKEDQNYDSLDAIKQLEVACLEKDNTINSLENELKQMNYHVEQYVSLELELQNKEALVQDNLDVINELEAVCVEKDNRINSLEKELGDINCQLEQYISAVCSMQARLEASKPNLESMLHKIDSHSNSLELLNLIDQLEKDYAEELEQSEISKSKLEIKLNKAVQVIHKLKKQLKNTHIHVLKLNEEVKLLKAIDYSNKDEHSLNSYDDNSRKSNNIVTSSSDFSTQIDLLNELALYKEENINFKGIIENLHVNNFMLWKELDNMKKTDRNIRGSSLPPMTSTSTVTGQSFTAGSERSVSPVSQISSNSFDGDSVNCNQIKDLQRKMQRTTQQLNQMRVERNRIHQEYTRIRQLKEEGDQKISDLLKHIDTNVNQDNILHEKDQLVEMNNKYSVKIVELQAEIDMTKVRNSILETKCKKMEWKLNNQRRKYDQLVLKVDEKEQELDRYSDEIRRNHSLFEKDRLDWLREKKELKLSNKNKDEKISNLRQRLSTKSKEIDGENLKKESADDNEDNDYLSEIEHLRKQLSQQKLEYKQCLQQHKEEVCKYKGQFEELIDDNRQLKRKLAFDQSDSKSPFIEMAHTSKTGGPFMQIIDEGTELSDFSTLHSSTESNAILAKVVLEKEKLIRLLSQKEEQLNKEKLKSHKFDEKDSEFENGDENESNSLEWKKEVISKQTLDKSTQICVANAAIRESKNQSTSTIGNNDICNEYVQTNSDYESDIIDTYKKQLIDCLNNQCTQTINDLSRSVVDKAVEVKCVVPISFAHNGTETDAQMELEYFSKSFKPISHSIGLQSDCDPLIDKLNQDILLKDKSLTDFNCQISLKNTQLSKLEQHLLEAEKVITLSEVKSLDYQEMISHLQLSNIELEKEYKQQIHDLNLEIMKCRESHEAEPSPVPCINETSQVNESQFENGWDMEWEYEKMNNVNQSQNIDDNVKTKDQETVTEFSYNEENDLSCFLTELDILLNSYSDSICYQEIRNLMMSYQCNEDSNKTTKLYSPSNVNINNLVGILREEIIQLKQSLNDKNHEIGQLKCLRNHLQSELLESGQQIKDSNMEFLNLKENIQAVNFERNMLEQKLENLESRFKKLVNFIRMLGFDLRRLRNSSPISNELASPVSGIDEQNVIGVTQSFEHELHKLLEQMHERDLKLEKSINQGLEECNQNDLVNDRAERIEQLSFAIHRLQLHHGSTTTSEHNTTHSNLDDIHDDSKSSSNDHDECQNLMVELSELLEKKQVEIEELKSRLFLATDQLIHFRTFFADPDYKMKREYLPVHRNNDPLSTSMSEPGLSKSTVNHTRLLVESEDDGQFSDSDDQSVLSPDGSTIIRVERIARTQKQCPNILIGKERYKRVFNLLNWAVSNGRRHIFSFRSQPRLNIKTLLAIYMTFIHFILLRCIFL